MWIKPLQHIFLLRLLMLLLTWLLVLLTRSLASKLSHLRRGRRGGSGKRCSAVLEEAARRWGHILKFCLIPDGNGGKPHALLLLLLGELYVKGRSGQCDNWMLGSRERCLYHRSMGGSRCGGGGGDERRGRR